MRWKFLDRRGNSPEISTVVKKLPHSTSSSFPSSPPSDLLWLVAVLSLLFNWYVDIVPLHPSLHLPPSVSSIAGELAHFLKLSWRGSKTLGSLQIFVSTATSTILLGSIIFFPPFIFFFSLLISLLPFLSASNLL